MAIDVTLKIERLKGELRALEDTRLYIKYDIFVEKLNILLKIIVALCEKKD